MESLIRNITSAEEQDPRMNTSNFRKEQRHDSKDVDNDLRRIIEDIQARILVIGAGGAGNTRSSKVATDT